ncbi:hypothetical protein [Glaciibacter psychrotolerans]|uniref:Uncharacterized protein n=1 Tax=Glaciibacter psychrotolerans TaxID=670054 RepID=A0A7Z0EDX6_9MICO|nr:hypothetical protein [Leifsonia psychrotolerans]NYJ19154.1 hypothetical protein [Leifsonia psychrotolerans]
MNTSTVRTPIRREDIRKGDLIRKEYTERLRSTVAHEYVAESDGDTADPRTTGNFFLLDRPVAPVVLPTETGIYMDATGGIWSFQTNGNLALKVESSAGWFNDEHVAGFAPFTRLEPVAVTAEKVLNRVAKLVIFSLMGDGGEADLKQIAAEFGVTS